MKSPSIIKRVSTNDNPVSQEGVNREAGSQSGIDSPKHGRSKRKSQLVLGLILSAVLFSAGYVSSSGDSRPLPTTTDSDSEFVMGYATTSDDKLFSYVDGIYTGVRHDFDDTVEAVSFTGSAIYVITSGKELKQCDIDGNCKTIAGFGDSPVGVSFAGDGSGAVITDGNKIAWFTENQYRGHIQHTFEDTPVAVSYTGSSIYVVTAGKELKQCDTGGDCKTIVGFGDSPVGVSFAADGSGAVITDGNKIAWFTENQNRGHIHTFEDTPIAVSYTGSSIYVVTAGKELMKCDTGGDCTTIDTYDSKPSAVSFAPADLGSDCTNPTEWMACTFASNASTVTLSEVAMPGSHDTGTWEMTRSNAKDLDFIKSCSSGIPDLGVIDKWIIAQWGRTQELNTMGQASTGARYFDVRGVVDDGLRHCHTLAGSSWNEIFGTDGHTQGLLQFVQAHPKEILVVDITHFYDHATDDVASEYKDYVKDNLCPDVIDPSMVGKSHPGQMTIQEIWDSGKNIALYIGNDAGWQASMFACGQDQSRYVTQNYDTDAAANLYTAWSSSGSDVEGAATNLTQWLAENASGHDDNLVVSQYIWNYVSDTSADYVAFLTGHTLESMTEDYLTGTAASAAATIDAAAKKYGSHLNVFLLDFLAAIAPTDMQAIWNLNSQ